MSTSTPNRGSTTTYKYNAANQRLSKTTGIITTNSIWENGQIAFDYVNNNGTYSKQQYLQSYGQDGTVTNGTIMANTLDGKNNVVGSLAPGINMRIYNSQFDAYGNNKLSQNTSTPFGYDGYYTDGETGLCYLNARYYDPASQQFTQEDTYWGNVNDPMSLNLYNYCASNPVNYIDPTGQYAVALVLAPSLTTVLGAASSGIITSITASITSIQTAIATSWLPVVAIAATAVAIVGIVYTVNRVMALSASAASTVSAVQAKVKSGGINSNQLRDNTVYVITRMGTADVVYVGRTSNFQARMSAHEKRFPKSGYDKYAIATNLTLAQARAMEQAIITAYGIDTLKNLINSISPSKWGNFMTEFSQMQTLIESFFDPE